MSAPSFGSIRLGRTPGSIRRGPAGAGELDTEEYDESLREDMEDMTDDFLHALYAHLAPMLAKRFEEFMRHSDSEVAALLEVARSVGIDVTEEEFVAPDVSADRITWEPVARSATLALFDWLVEHTRDQQQVLPATTWAQNAAGAVDFEAFRRKTSLTQPDARIAMTTTAQAIADWEPLQTPKVLRYADQYLSVWADTTNDTVGGLTTAEQPLIYVPIESEPVIEIEGDELTYVELAQHSAELVPIAPTVDYSEVDDCLVVSGAIDADSSVTLDGGLCLRPESDWTYERLSDGLRLVSGGHLAFSVPRTVGVHVIEGGLVLERDPSKGFALPETIGGEAASAGFSVGESDSGDAEVIARYIHK